MDYYQTEVYAPIEKEWVSASEVYRDGELFVIPESKKLTADEVNVEIERLRQGYRNLEFRIMPFNEK